MEGKGRYIIGIAVALACMLATFFLGRMLGSREGMVQVHVEAIKMGHARHVIVDEFGQTEFRWLDHGDVDLVKKLDEPKKEEKKP